MYRDRGGGAETGSQGPSGELASLPPTGAVCWGWSGEGRWSMWGRRSDAEHSGLRRVPGRCGAARWGLGFGQGWARQGPCSVVAPSCVGRSCPSAEDGHQQKRKEAAQLFAVALIPVGPWHAGVAQSSWATGDWSRAHIRAALRLSDESRGWEVGYQMCRPHSSRLHQLHSGIAGCLRLGHVG